MAGIGSWILKFYTINQYMQLSNMQLSDTVCTAGIRKKVSYHPDYRNI